MASSHVESGKPRILGPKNEGDEKKPYKLPIILAVS